MAFHLRAFLFLLFNAFSCCCHFHQRREVESTLQATVAEIGESEAALRLARDPSETAFLRATLLHVRAKELHLRVELSQLRSMELQSKASEVGLPKPESADLLPPVRAVRRFCL